MKTFFNILQRVVNANTIKYPDEIKPFNVCNISVENDMYASFSIYMFICKIYKEFNESSKHTYITKFVSSKFNALNAFFNNKFNNNKAKKELLDAFSKAQRIYFSLIRFVNIYKMKKYPKVVTEDLSMTALDVNNKNTFILIQNKSIYLFSLNDLIRIIETAISNSPSFFPDPTYPKNPFNNEELSDATLYNIYFKMKESGRVVSTIFHLFFLSKLNTELFVINNEAFLREYSIKKYVFTSPALYLHDSIIEMIKTNPYTKKLLIHNDFPKEQLVEIFRPFLYYYCIVNYDIRGIHKISKYRKVLYLKMKKFYEYNKSFGRRYIELVPIPFSFSSPCLANNVSLSNLLDTSVSQESQSVSNTDPFTMHRCKYKRKGKLVFNNKHINFYNIDIKGMHLNAADISNLLDYINIIDNLEDEEEEEETSDDEEDEDEEEDEESAIEDEEAIDDDENYDDDASEEEENEIISNNTILVEEEYDDDDEDYDDDSIS
jgi:hypothetical protein